MNIQDLGSVGELIGAVATVATLAYLAFQIRNNTKEQKRQALIGFVDRLNARERNIRSEPGLLEVVMKGEIDYQSLSKHEMRRFGSSESELFNAIESYLEYAKSGDLKPETVEVMNRRLKLELQHPGVRMWWSHWGRYYFAKDFVLLIDELIAEEAA